MPSFLRFLSAFPCHAISPLPVTILQPRFMNRIMRDMFKDCNVEVVMAPTEFSTSQLARELGVYEQKIRQLDRRGILAPRRDIFGNRIFSVEDLRKGREYLASNKRG